MVCPWPPSWSSPPCSSDCIHFCLFVVSWMCQTLGAAVAFSSPWGVHSPYTFSLCVLYSQIIFRSMYLKLYLPPAPKNYTLTLHHSISFLPCFTFPSSTFHLMYCILYIIIYCLSYSGLNLPIKNVNFMRVRFWSVFVFFHSCEQSWAHNHHKKIF